MKGIKKFIYDIKGYSITAVVALVLSIVFLFHSYIYLSGFFFGVFITRNTDIFNKIFDEYIRPKI